MTNIQKYCNKKLVQILAFVLVFSLELNFLLVFSVTNCHFVARLLLILTNHFLFSSVSIVTSHVGQTRKPC